MTTTPIKPLALAWLTLSFAQASVALDNGFGVITSNPTVVTEGERFTLLLAGPNQPCGLELKDVVIDNDMIDVNFTQSITTVCAAVVRPFRVPVTVFKPTESAKAGVYKVKVNYLGVPGTEPSAARVLAFAMVPVLKNINSQPIRPENGNWNAERGGNFATSGSGVSFNIETQGDTFVAMTNFYTPKGDPTWYFQSGTVDRGIYDSTAYLVGGGQSLFGAYKPPATVDAFAQIAFEFTTPTQGTAWISQLAGEGLLDGLKLMPISISRFNYGFGNRSLALKGKWLLASDEKTASAPQWLLLSPKASASNVLNSYESGEFDLNCTLDSRKPDSIPGGCVLLRAGTQVASFTSVGYTKLRGVDPLGNAVTLYRIE